ncbi:MULTISPECIES: sugar MFS transporter [Labilibaculum]|uniref:MFS transporter n=1 Tax=Labilibaculum euxinus TaxID=2686357 RepID=A0A7M4D6P4_9BACT|nr:MULTISPECIES: MFS transporter [Labilibaculum]MUP38323.1 MFS transporter [Labilibaculum euxinus]MVB07528.1 MFS transporter [Labilibaculum euxinus]
MKNNYLKSGPIFLAFLCMGFGDVVGPLTSQLQSEYELSNVLAGLVTFMGFIMFGLLSVPMGLYQDRKGKKRVLLLGMLAALVGLVLPILGNFSSFGLLLGSLLLLGTGATLLQVAGNPIMRDVSPEGKYSRNLSFGQFIKAIGSLSGALIPLLAAKYWGLDWKLLFPIYSGILLVAAIYLYVVTIEEKKDDSASPASFGSVLALLKNPYVFFMVLAIFLYVGSEVSMSAKLPNYLSEKFSYDIKELGLWGTLFFFIALMTGRFLGGVILNWMSPSRFLKITTLLSLIGIAGLYIATSSIMGFAAIFLIGLGFANIFPLVFSIAIDAMPERSNEISGLMVTAIIGGAIVPVIFGAVADVFSLMGGFVVTLVCIGYIFGLSFYKRK